MLLHKCLGNGVTFTISEHSRPIAADRWYVKVVGVITLAPAAEHWAGIAEPDPTLLALVQRHLGDELEHRLIKERNFIAAVDKEEVVGELVAKLTENIGGYLAGEDFPARFLAMKYRQAREVCRLAMVREATSGDEAEEPVDFSHCFK